MLVTREPVLRRHWHPTARVHDVTDAPVRVRLLGEPVVLWRSGDAVAGAIDECPHRGAALSAGTVSDGCIVCPYHAWAYEPGGRAVHIPQLDAGVPIPPKARLRPVHVRERYGLVWVALDDPVAEIPDFPEAAADGWRIVPEFFETWMASAPRIIDNSLDIAHTSIVHRATIGDYDHPEVAPYEVETTAAGLRTQVYVNTRDVEVQGAGAEGDAVRDVTVEIVGPFSFIGRISYDTGISHVIITMASPVDDGESRFIQFVARNDAPDAVADAAIVGLDRRVVDEDKVILELTKHDFPLDITAEVHLRCDRVTVEYRRYLARVVAA